MLEECLERSQSEEPLTGLASRTLLLDHVTRLVPDASGFAVIHLDLDQFRAINNAYGLSAGDQLLCEVAMRLEQCLSPAVFIARPAADEFLLLVEKLEEAEPIQLIVDRIRLRLAAPFAIGETDLYCSACIGVYIETARVAPEAILRNANIALQHARRCGPGSVHYYQKRMYEQLRGRMNLVADLKRCEDGDRMSLRFQPVVALKEGTPLALEALLRWDRPGGEASSPGDFIPVAEEIGIIRRLGHWVIRQACRQFRIWRDRGLEIAYLSINVSVHQLEDLNFFEEVQAILNEEGVPGRVLVFEITESGFLETDGSVLEILRRLREVGIKIAIDDFGTGYSSLSSLRDLPADFIKIDQSFLNGVPEQPRNGSVLRAILALGAELGLETIAEGVESEAQVAFLKEAGCDRAQGYFFSRPLAAENIPVTFMNRVWRERSDQ